MNGGTTQEQYLYCDSAHPHQLSNLSQTASTSTCSSKGAVDYTGSYDSWGTPYEEPIFGKYSEKEDAEIEHTDRNREFRTWLNVQYNLQIASQPNEIVRIAQLHHPTLPLTYAS